jgi:Ca2+-binding RTX toxin-like protein
VHGTDQIRLDHDVFAALPQGTMAAAKFYSGPGVITAHDTDDRIVYDTTTGTLYYDADGAGGTAAVAFAVLSNLAVITAADFMIVA